MSRRLVDWGATPSLVLCSAAQRARETLAGVVRSLNGNTRIEIEETLYTFDPNEIMRRLIQTPGSDTDVLLIGHNPALEVTTGLLAADGNPAAMRQLSLKFPTCALRSPRIYHGQLARTRSQYRPLGETVDTQGRLRR